MCLGWSSARPVKGGAQCHPVPQAVRSILGHGLDVRGLGLGPSAAVDDPETADRAGVVVGPLDTRGEHPVANLTLLNEREARDELGLGPIRDSLADLLFPGTSTIQTRLRYFLVVPWVYRALAVEGVEGAEIWRKGRDLELEVADHLRGTSEAGVFGRRAGRRLRRLPSSVYWLGLGTWGLRYDRRPSRWHQGLPARPRGFPRIDTLALTSAEAQYLQDRVTQSVPDTLLAHLFLRANPAEAFSN